MKIINAYIGIKKRINDLFGWKTNNQNLTTNSIQESMLINMQRYGKGLSGANSNGALLGNSVALEAVTYDNLSKTLTLNTGSALVTNHGNIVNTAKSITITNVLDGDLVYFKYELTLDNSTTFPIQNSQNMGASWDEKTNVLSASTDGILTTNNQDPTDNYVLIGRIQDEVFIPNYPKLREGYFGGSNFTGEVIDIVTGVDLVAQGNSIKLVSHRSKLIVVDGFIKSKLASNDLEDSITITHNPIAISGNPETITPSINIS